MKNKKGQFIIGSFIFFVLFLLIILFSLMFGIVYFFKIIDFIISNIWYILVIAIGLLVAKKQKWL